MTGPRVVAAVLAVLAGVVLLTSATYPPGSQGVPGPALVPRVLGASLLAVSLWILRIPGHGAPPIVRHHRAIALTVLLLVAYATLWQVVPFAVLTGLVLLAFFRVTGIGWRAAVLASGAMAVTLLLLFERGLGVRF